MAFRNADASMALLAFNAGKGDQEIAVQGGSRRFGLRLPAGAAVTAVWR